MVQAIASLADVAASYDAIVLDQWGVLHDGTQPYPGAIEAISALHGQGTRFAILSNSGKRAAPNALRIARMGFSSALFEAVMTSGEALWQDISAGRVAARVLFPIERAHGDAALWAEGLDIALTDEIEQAEAVLLMGLPDNAAGDAFGDVLDHAISRGLQVICTNPDRASPRAGGHTVTSPGQLAQDHVARGGDVRFYGKPHRPIFEAVARDLSTAPGRLLMVGDSLEHDIAGAAHAGWDSVFIQSGLHAGYFARGGTVTALAAQESASLPTYTLASLGATEGQAA
ncbi:MAG: TIGR01459 family HAD-type hydrolase [Pseudomonadota bacterium]